MDRLENYIETHQLTGKLRLWTVGYSRSAAVANIFAADAVETQRFEGVCFPLPVHPPHPYRSSRSVMSV